MNRISLSLPLLACLCLAAPAAFSHVGLPAGGAPAGSSYDATFTVGHACEGAQATTALAVQLPAGFRITEAVPRAGWTLTAPPAGSQGGEVRWTAASAASALRGHDKGAFTVRGVLPATPGVLYLPVHQVCDVGEVRWDQVPAAGDGARLAQPAARLEVLAPGSAAVDVKDPWVRATVAGQGGTGAFMTLQAPAGARLVGVSTPVAGVAEVHEMKMEGGTMRMRAITALELPPGQSVPLAPGGYHVMLMDLKEPLAAGRSIPLTLRFEDAAGARSERTLQAEVRQAGAAKAAPAHHHH
ncbi:copper chaperone PCu(A)C [Pulveribacter suum]|uniref:YncI copper-binding domain-containing protein n=1 Tax=Pulveribacter suum TaxID=2116657 RepID=A0A2P1NIC0_9BURK|nr:copper chaperone PCu(A)C [Pulveribacter suum]AVP56818.1 hypothetical protein C7H73_03450 [Pulveribacter suum]